MSVYLIDYENVNFAGLEGVGNLTPADEVIIFYSNAASTIPMNLHIDVQKSGARMQYIRIERTGKNYLDFQLSALSGYLVGTTDQTDFVVISRDTGYDSVLDLWNNQTFVGRTLTFRRQDSIGGNIPVKPRRRRGRKMAAKAESPAETKKTESPVENAAEEKQAQSAAADAETTGKAKKTGGRKKNVSAAEAEQKTASQGTKKKAAATGGKQASSKSEKKSAASAKQKKAPETGQTKASPEEQKPAEKTAEDFVSIVISASEKKNIRSAVKELSLKPTDYTKIYRTFEKTPDKQAYNTGLIRAFKNQELGNRIYKATLPVFNSRHK